MDRIDATWRKSSYSNGTGTDCVEAGIAEPGHVLVRDTKDREGTTLSVSAESWRQFTTALR